MLLSLLWHFHTWCHTSQLCCTSIINFIFPSLLSCIYPSFDATISGVILLSLTGFLYSCFDASTTTLILISLLWCVPLLWCFFHNSDPSTSSLWLLYIFCHIHTSIAASIFDSMLLCVFMLLSVLKCYNPYLDAFISAIMPLSLLWCSYHSGCDSTLAVMLQFLFWCL